MADLFLNRAGAVSFSPNMGPAFIVIEGFSSPGALLMTSLATRRQQATQFLKSLNNLIYAYAFGEDVGSVTVGGLLFLTACSGPAAVSYIDDFYSQNNTYNRSSPIRIAIGGAAFRCYLETFVISGESNGNNTVSFQLGFALLPRSQSL